MSARVPVAIGRGLLLGLLIVLAAAGVLTTRTTGRLVQAPAGSSTDPADLIGVDWLLSKYITQDGVTHDSRSMPGAAGVRFTSKKDFGFTDGCNGYGADITVSAGRLSIGAEMGTAIGCGQVPPIADILQRDVTWYIERRALTISALDGAQLIFVVRSSPFPSIYPGSTAITFDGGRLGSAIYRLYFSQDRPGSFSLSGDLRQSPQAQWQGIGGGMQKVGWRGPVPDRLQGCYAAIFGGHSLTMGWATTRTHRIVVRNSRDSTVTNIPLFHLPGTGNLLAFAGFTHHVKGVTTLYAYDATGKPLGPPCMVKP